MTELQQSGATILVKMSVSPNASFPIACASEDDTIVITWIVCVLIILIFVGNITVIIVIMRSPAIEQTGYVYTLNLAIADIFVGIMCLMHVTMYFLNVVSIAWCLCEIVMFLISCTLSVSSIVCIAFDRYLAVMKPLIYSTRIRQHTRYAKGVVSLIWIYSIFYGCLPLIGWRNDQFVPCRHCWFAQILPESFVIALFIGKFILPVIVLFFFYGSMLKVSLHQANQIADLTRSVIPNSRWDSRKRAIITLTLIMGCYFMTWAPFFTVLFAHTMSKSPKIQIIVHSYLFILAISNSCINPLVYAYWNREFRTLFSSWFNREGNKIRHSLSSRTSTVTFISNFGFPSPVSRSS